MILGLIFHILGAVVWVGGMFFAYVVLRPYVGTLGAEARLAQWRGVFQRFFPWVWASILALLVSGYGMLFLALGGFAGAGMHVHIMNLTGLIMMALFAHLYFAPWKRMQRALDTGETAGAAKALGQIRVVIEINLVLGLLTCVIGASGRYWG
jgi:uncharacterized membrane protein